MDLDPVIDYMIMEAVAIKVSKEDEQAHKEREKEQWRKETTARLEGFR